MPLTVLLVDDNALFRDGIAEILRADGRFEVAGQVSTGEEAVEAADRLQPGLILMDLRMPGIGGAEAIRRIRAARPTVPIGVLTVFETAEWVEPAMEAGASGYLFKDATPAELCDVAIALAQGTWESAAEPRPASRTGAMAASAALLQRLTAREVEVLRALATGATREAIARGLGISPRTLRNHISHTYRKLGIYDRAQAMIVAIRAGLVDIRRP